MLEETVLEVVEYLAEFNLASEEDGDHYRFLELHLWKFTPDDLNRLPVHLSGVPNALSAKTRKLLRAIAMDDSALCLTSKHTYVRDAKAFMQTNSWFHKLCAEVEE